MWIKYLFNMYGWYFLCYNLCENKIICCYLYLWIIKCYVFFLIIEKLNESDNFELINVFFLNFCIFIKNNYIVCVSYLI